MCSRVRQQRSRFHTPPTIHILGHYTNIAQQKQVSICRFINMYLLKNSDAIRIGVFYYILLPLAPLLPPKLQPSSTEVSKE